MAGEATALVTFAPRSVFQELHGPAGGRIWRPGYLACLIEKHLPVWVITPIGFAAGETPDPRVVVSHGAEGRPAVGDLVILMAGLFGGSELLNHLAREEGLLDQHGARFVALPSVDLPRWDEGDEEDDLSVDEPIVASDELLAEAGRIVAAECRIAVMAYPGSLVAAEDSIQWLRGLGADVDEFRLAVAGEAE